MKKLLSVLLCLTLLFGILPPVAAYAEPGQDLSLEDEYLARQAVLTGETSESVSAAQIKIPDLVIETNPIYASYFETHPLPKFKEDGAKSRGITFSYAKSVYGAGAQLRQALREHQNTIYIGYRGAESDFTASDSVDSLISDIWDNACMVTANPREGDYIKTSWAVRSRSVEDYSISDDTLYFILKYEVQYWGDLTATDENRMAAEADAVINSFGFTDATSAYDKIHTIYQYIADNIAYSAYDDDPLRQTAYSAIILKDTVCAGYSQLMYYMMWKCGVPCRIICGSGSGELHAWNTVWFRGNWYNMDVTWDAGWPDYHYFLRGRDSGFYGDGTNGTHVTNRDGELEYNYTTLVNNTYSSDYGAKCAADYGNCQNHTDASTSYHTENNLYYDWCSICGQSNPILNVAEDLAWFGSYGDIYWALYNNGDLLIGGNGNIPDYGCGWLSFNNFIRSVVLSDSVTGIGTAAFMDCEMMTDITVPDSVTMLGDGAFLGCRNLEWFRVPASISSIEMFTFSECESLTDIGIPSTVTSVGKYAFYGCHTLTNVYYGGSRAAWDHISISDGNEPLTRATLTPTQPAPVLSAAANMEKVVVSWEAVPYASQYSLYRRAKENGTWGDWALLTKLTATSYTDTNVIMGGTYQYRAKANCGGWGDYSEKVQVTVPVPPPPEAPVIEVEAAEEKNIISWGAVSGATQYTISRRVNETGSWGDWATISTQSGTRYTDTAVTPGWKCEYRIKASGIGGTSGYSNRVIVTVLAPQPPAAPVIEVTSDAEKVTVRWDAVPGAAKYQVYRREKAEGKWSSWMLVFSAKPILFNDTNVTGGVVYEYRVKSVKTLSDGSSLKSGYSNREMIGLQRPDAPVISVTATTGKNTVKWNAVTGADYYVVYWRDKSSGDWSAWTASEQVTGLSYAHNGVMRGVEYQYRVRAANGVWSEYSNRVSVKAK